MIVKHGPQDYTNGLESNSPTLPHAAKMATTFIYLFITLEGSTKTHTIQEKIYILMSIVNSVFCDLSFTKVMFACFCQQQCFSLVFCRIIQENKIGLEYSVQLIQSPLSLLPRDFFAPDCMTAYVLCSRCRCGQMNNLFFVCFVLHDE